jgi:magnesium-transporting ATPase (P-type)
MFTSKRKKMSTVLENVQDTYSGTGYRLHVKGAAELVLAKCSHFIDENGERQKMEDRYS